MPGSGGFGAAAASHFWTPKDVGSLLWAWWIATVGVTVTGSGVSTWADQSGNGSGRNLLQATDANRPLTGIHTLGGRNVLNFTTTGAMQMSTTDQPPAMPLTVFTCHKVLGIGVDREIFDIGGGGQGALNHLTANSPTNSYGVFDTVNERNTAHAAQTSTGVATVTLLKNTTGQFYENGVQYGGSLNVGTVTTTVFRFGAGGGLTPNFDMAEAFVASGDATGHQDYWYQYCRNQWGI